MKTSRQFKSLSTFFLFVIGMALSASLVGAFSHPGSSTERMSNSGGVKISASYLPQESDRENETTFRINMSTHYVDLSEYDLKEISFISVDNGPLQQATGWTASGDNHHVQGILRFPGHRYHDSQSVQLIVKNIGDSKTRSFEWNSPLSE